MLSIRISLVLVAAFLLGGCATKYYNYSGSETFQGTGGASETVNDIDIWIEGTPPRPFTIIGVITDNRPGGPIPMATRKGQITSLAKKNGGDAILFKFDESQFVGTYSSGSAFTSGQATAYGSPGYARAYGTSTTTSTGMTQNINRRSSRFYVIKYK